MTYQPSPNAPPVIFAIAVAGLLSFCIAAGFAFGPAWGFGLLGCLCLAWAAVGLWIEGFIEVRIGKRCDD